MQKPRGTKEDEWSKLMRSALDGDRLAYQRLLTEIAPHVRGVARRGLPHSVPVDVEDVVQETLLAVHLKRSTWNPSLPLLPWLNAITRYKAIDAVRRKGGRKEFNIDDVVEHLAAPDGSGESSLDAETVLAGLDQRDRMIVEQIYLQGRSAADVGARLGMSEGAVRVALHRALKALSRKFNGQKS